MNEIEHKKIGGGTRTGLDVTIQRVEDDCDVRSHL